MQKACDKTVKIININISEEEFFSKFVAENHPFRKLKKIIKFNKIVDEYRNLYSDMGRTGFDIEKGFKSLLIQFWEDYSDREMEKCLKENIAVRWFCGFGVEEETPDHTYFCRLRKRLGTENIANIFNEINNELRSQGLFGDVFKFIDASTLITKTALWEERDKALKNGDEKLNNKNLEKYVADKDARWGNKGKSNYWFGYKRHHCVDMRYGLIDKLCVTPGNILDYDVMKNICPNNCMIFADKLYDCKKSDFWIKANNCHAGTIRKNNNKNKDKKLDSWHSKIRMPFEGTFSKLRKRTKFRSKVKVLGQCYYEAICHNLKKAINILPSKSGA